MGKRLYLTRKEVELILEATSGARHALRDRCMILMSYLHGLRVSELSGLKLTDIDLSGERIYIRRLKNGLSTSHPIPVFEREWLRRWIGLSALQGSGSPWLFPSAKGGRMSRQNIYRLLKRYGEHAALPLRVHPHMLRHGCGYELAEQGMDTRLIQDYLGHRNIRHTVHYTAGNAGRFARAWKASEDEPVV